MRIDKDLIQKKFEQQPSIKIARATIDPAYASGRPRVIKDGETVVQGKAYPHLESYTPVAGDRVFILEGVILGKIV